VDAGFGDERLHAFNGVMCFLDAEVRCSTLFLQILEGGERKPEVVQFVAGATGCSDLCHFETFLCAVQTIQPLSYFRNSLVVYTWLPALLADHMSLSQRFQTLHTLSCPSWVSASQALARPCLFLIYQKPFTSARADPCRSQDLRQCDAFDVHDAYGRCWVFLSSS
jgi:hypothetical protein